MTKKLIVLFLLATMAGCTYEGTKLRDIIEDPRKLVRDPLYTDYKADRAALESSYLRKDITYAEYVEKKEELEYGYSKEVQSRNDKIRE